MPTLRRTAFVPAAAAVLGLAGCSATYDKDFFDYDREQSRNRQVFEAQYAAAATQEASLRPSHFAEADDGTGPRLNALGRERLDYIVASRKPGEAVTVSVDAPAVEQTEVDQMVDVATMYVLAMRLPEGAVTVLAGDAAFSSPASEAMAAERSLRGGQNGPNDLFSASAQ